jgi:hypothetical protein
LFSRGQEANQIDQISVPGCGWRRLREAAEPARGGTLTVSLPANASAAAVDRFRRLRTGESVSVEGSFVTAVMVELNRFL